MTKILKKLESLGYISRQANPNDKRSMLVKLEDKGEEVLLACLEDLIELKKETYESLTEQDKEDLKRILKKVTLSLS